MSKLLKYEDIEKQLIEDSRYVFIDFCYNDKRQKCIKFLDQKCGKESIIYLASFMQRRRCQESYCMRHKFNEVDETKYELKLDKQFLKDKFDEFYKVKFSEESLKHKKELVSKGKREQSEKLALERCEREKDQIEFIKFERINENPSIIWKCKICGNENIQKVIRFVYGQKCNKYQYHKKEPQIKTCKHCGITENLRTDGLNKVYECCVECYKTIQKEQEKQTQQKVYKEKTSLRQDEIAEKRKETNLEKYGVENTFKSKELQIKALNTKLQNRPEDPTNRTKAVNVERRKHI